MPAAQGAAVAPRVSGGAVAAATYTQPAAELSAPAPLVSTPSAPPHPLLTPPDPVPPQVLASVNVGSGPSMAVYDGGNGYVYVVNSISNSVSILSGTSLVATVPVSNGTVIVGEPTYLVYDPANGFVYVVDRYNFESIGGAVSVLNGTSLLAVVLVGLLPSAAAYDAADEFVYVSEGGSNEVAVLDGTTVIANLKVGSDPGALVYDPADSSVYVANRASANVTVLAGTAVAGSVGVGTQPDALAFDPPLSAVYVENNQSGNVTVLVGMASVGNVLTGTNPSFALFDPVNGYMYVTNRNSSDVSLLNGLGVVTSVPTGAAPVWAAFNPGTGLVYIADAGAAAVTVVDGTAFLGNVAVGNGPTSAVPDLANSDVYVTNSNSHNVSVIATAYAVTFNETGLPGGSSWSVVLATKSLASTSASILFGKLPGSYPYSVAGPSGYRLVSSTPASPVLVTDTAVLVTVTFAAVSNATYDLVFQESGLSGMCGRSFSWSVTVGNVTQTSSTTTITFVEPNGTYNYSVVGPSGYTVTSETPASPVTLAGAPVTVDVTFAKFCGHGGYNTFSITFTEFGLRWGTTWCVTVGSTVCSSSGSIRFMGLSSGTYSFTVSPIAGYTAQPASGTVTIYGHSEWVRINFSGGHSHHCGGDGGTAARVADRIAR
ncbi:MAG: hypothetical protein ACLQC7_08535 [Thermoplasmata archaeon]